MMLPPNLSLKWGKKLQGIGKFFQNIFPDVEENLVPAGVDIDVNTYYGMSLVNGLFLSTIFTSLMTFIMVVQKRPLNELIGLTLAIFMGIMFLFLILYMRYPGIIALKKAELLNQDLIYALKDIVIQITSGSSLYESFKDLAKSEHIEVKKQFKKIIQEIDTGKSIIAALENAAISTKSEYFKRTCWQIINSLKTGSNLKNILSRIIGELAQEQKNKIRNYARELNLWSLLYMLFAVAVPSIGSTMLVILSSFAGFGISKGFFILFIVISFFIQIILIGFVKSRRPSTD